jgi:hypothetical protein
MEDHITPSMLSSEIRSWVNTRNFHVIRMEEDPNPKKDPQDDYTVVYVAALVPERLRYALIELHLTEEGNVGFGLETWDRIAQRISVPRPRISRKRFAAGREPSFRSLYPVFQILELVSQGNIAIVTTVLPILGLLGTTATLLNREDQVAVEFCRELGWARTPQISLFKRIVTFDPWY